MEFEIKRKNYPGGTVFNAYSPKRERVATINVSLRPEEGHAFIEMIKSHTVGLEGGRALHTLYKHVEAWAREKKMKRIRTNAYVYVTPFFEKRGYTYVIPKDQRTVIGSREEWRKKLAKAPPGESPKAFWKRSRELQHRFQLIFKMQKRLTAKP